MGKHDIRWHGSVSSTMDLAAALADEGAAHGVVVAAEQQTAGRGRRGSTWVSPPGAGLYFSLIVRSAEALPRADHRLPLLTLAAGVAVRDGIETASGLRSDLKWPNDVIVGRRKLAGILAEGIGIGTTGPTVIVGVGVNLRPASYPPEVAMRATSIEGELGRPVDRDRLLTAILDMLSSRLSGLDRNAGDILQAWRAASPSAAGTRVEWDDHPTAQQPRGGGPGRHRGVTAGIDETGALLVKTATGVERIIAGELHWNL